MVPSGSGIAATAKPPAARTSAAIASAVAGAGRGIRANERSRMGHSRVLWAGMPTLMRSRTGTQGSGESLYGARMITGIHAVMFSEDAERVRAFIRDVLGFESVDAGGGW